MLRMLHSLAYVLGLMTASIGLAEQGWAAAACERREPFLLAPVIERVGSPERLAEALNTLEPGGPSGEVVVGYTLGIPLFSLFIRNADGWHFEPAALDSYLSVIRQVPRPVVVYLLANHFSPTGPLVRELASDPANLMVMGNGRSPATNYFGTNVIPFTLSTNPDIPVNTYRNQALSRAMAALVSLGAEFPGRIRAVTLLGEVHHLVDDILNAPGNYKNLQFTDYSPRSREEFRGWLKEKFRRLSRLNQATAAKARRWSDIAPPNRDLHQESFRDVKQHIDAYASGFLPVFGWLNSAERPGAIAIYLDGRRKGTAVHGLSRLDVYEAVEAIGDPNTGFRYDLDYRRLAPGKHRIEVVLEDGGRRLRLFGRDIWMLNRKGRLSTRVWDEKLRQLAGVPGVAATAKLSAWLDHPEPDLKLFYNPLAALWQEFRETQVENFLADAWRRAAQSGFDTRRIYSYELNPYLNGSWNDMVFAVGRTNRKSSPYSPGVTLYGGQASSPRVAEWLGGRTYGVPEFNPLQFKDPQSVAAALAYQEAQCAAFVGPWYMVSDPDLTLASPGSFANFLIDPNNPRKGENYFYAAIQAMASR